jgi:hypothetical protein
MDAGKIAWRRRWLPPLLVLAGLVILADGAMLALTATTPVQRFLGWLIAAAGVCNSVTAGWLLWWVRSGRGGPTTLPLTRGKGRPVSLPTAGPGRPTPSTSRSPGTQGPVWQDPADKPPRCEGVA